MKKNSIYNILLAAIAFAGGMLSSCSNETEELSATDGGNLVQFTIGETKSRTTRDLTDLSQIKWEGGETVYVYSPEATTAAGKHIADYTVTVDDNGTAKLAYNKDGLLWNSSTANFYAYTGEDYFSDFTSTTLNFICPDFDHDLVEANVNGKTYYINNLKGRLLASSGEVSRNKPVGLTFKNLSTIVDLTLGRISHDMYLNKLELSYQISVNSLGLMEWDMESNLPMMGNFHTVSSTQTFKPTSAEHVIWGGWTVVRYIFFLTLNRYI